MADIQMGNNYLWYEVLESERKKAALKSAYFFDTLHRANIAYIISKFTMFNRIYSVYVPRQSHTRAPTANGSFEKPHNLM